ncbi:DMT family transporter [Solimicrobium silvestre]|uniref:EamA-like transporter family n=1 Tax=Solimicrobium silvestre TaxID=2099400 RepID=A0A2S9H401_9BURK|nr:DMT family transporter [Solimicrobium silvestre]PRC94714.1 EamA-like transporter family [Solimicrobium silvestre]
MKPANIVRLLLLGGMWGMSFIFMRIASPAFGPILTAFGRVSFGGLVLIALLLLNNLSLDWRRNARFYLVIGLVNTAVPFSLFSWAALSIPSAYMAIINAMAPLFAALFGAVLLSESLSAVRIFGFVLGVIGVAILVGIGPAHVNFETLSGIAASVIAAICYGYAAIYIRQVAVKAPPLAVAAGSQIAASLFLFPIALIVTWVHPPSWPTTLYLTVRSVGAIVLLGVICTGIAYALYFRLIADEGASRAVTVAFLIPIAATIWASLFLNERITIGTLCGMGLVIIAIGLVLGLVRMPHRQWISKEQKNN